jgi:hypothetical protein
MSAFEHTQMQQMADYCAGTGAPSTFPRLFEASSLLPRDAASMRGRQFLTTSRGSLVMARRIR